MVGIRVVRVVVFLVIGGVRVVVGSGVVVEVSGLVFRGVGRSVFVMLVVTVLGRMSGLVLSGIAEGDVK